jgi:hypothetical protein
VGLAYLLAEETVVVQGLTVQQLKIVQEESLPVNMVALNLMNFQLELL